MEKIGFHVVNLQMVALNRGYTENSGSRVKPTWVQISAPLEESLEKNIHSFAQPQLTSCEMGILAALHCDWEDEMM